MSKNSPFEREVTPQRIQVGIADDHPIVIDGLTTVLTQSPQVQIVGTARTAAEITALLATVVVHVLVLDLNGMGKPPLTLVRSLRRTYPQVAIVVFSSSVDLAPELLREGVRGYVTKEDLTIHLIDAIVSVRAGQQWLSPAVQHYLLRSRHLRQAQDLAPKELQVLQLLAEGLGTTAIAEQMRIDPRTVQNYITSLRQKTGCTERIQLVEWYRRLQPGDEPPSAW